MSGYYERCKAVSKTENLVDWLSFGLFIANIYLLISNNADFWFAVQLFIVFVCGIFILSIAMYPVVSMFSVAIEGRGKKELRNAFDTILRALISFGGAAQILALLLMKYSETGRVSSELIFGATGVTVTLLALIFTSGYDNVYYSKREAAIVLQSFVLLLGGFLILQSGFGFLIHALFI